MHLLYLPSLSFRMLTGKQIFHLVKFLTLFSRDLDRMGILSKHDQDLLLNNIQNLLKLANIRKSFDSIDKSEIDL